MSVLKFLVAALLVSAVAATVTVPMPAVQDNCDAQGLQSCGTGLSDCIQHNGGNPQQVCNCRQAYDMCLIQLGCSKHIVCAAIDACVETGCQASNCGENNQYQCQ